MFHGDATPAQLPSGRAHRTPSSKTSRTSWPRGSPMARLTAASFSHIASNPGTVRARRGEPGVRQEVMALSGPDCTSCAVRCADWTFGDAHKRRALSWEERCQENSLGSIKKSCGAGAWAEGIMKSPDKDVMFFLSRHFSLGSESWRSNLDGDLDPSRCVPRSGDCFFFP